MGYTTLLFDADGTLLDFNKSERVALLETLVHFGLTIDDNVIENYSKINDNLWKTLERGGISKAELRWRRFEILCGEYGYSCDANDMSEVYFSALSTKSFLLPDAYEVCEKLSKGCRLYLITNGFKVIQDMRFGSSPIARFFEKSFISEEIGYEKPSREYFDAVKAGIPNFAAEGTLVIGDSLSSDIAGGINAGIDVCWFNPAGVSTHEQMKIKYIITDLKMLYNITKQ